MHGRQSWVRSQSGLKRSGLRHEAKCLQVHVPAWGRVILCCLILTGAGQVMTADVAQSVQQETLEEKEANLRKQATGGLFQKWTFDQDRRNCVPAGFVAFSSREGPPADWMVQADISAPSSPNIVKASSDCGDDPCHQLLLALAQASVSLKPVDWHSLRVQRNTIYQ